MLFYPLQQFNNVRCDSSACNTTTDDGRTIIVKPLQLHALRAILVMFTFTN